MNGREGSMRAWVGVMEGGNGWSRRVNRGTAHLWVIAWRSAFVEKVSNLKAAVQAVSRTHPCDPTLRSVKKYISHTTASIERR